MKYTIFNKIKVKDTALDFTVPTGSADLHFSALQPGSTMGGWGPTILCFCTPFLFTFPRFHQVPVYSWVDSG